MTIKTLMILLQQYDPDLPVRIQIKEGKKIKQYIPTGIYFSVDGTLSKEDQEPKEFIIQCENNS